MSLIRHSSGPILTRWDIPDMPPDIVDPSSVFNPGAVMVEGKTVLLLRVQSRGRRTFTVPALSTDGLDFLVDDQPGLQRRQVRREDHSGVDGRCPTRPQQSDQNGPNQAFHRWFPHIEW